MGQGTPAGGSEGLEPHGQRDARVLLQPAGLLPRLRHRQWGLQVLPAPGGFLQEHPKHPVEAPGGVEPELRLPHLAARRAARSLQRVWRLPALRQQRGVQDGATLLARRAPFPALRGAPEQGLRRGGRGRHHPRLRAPRRRQRDVPQDQGGPAGGRWRSLARRRKRSGRGRRHGPRREPAGGGPGHRHEHLAAPAALAEPLGPPQGRGLRGLRGPHGLPLRADPRPGCLREEAPGGDLRRGQVGAHLELRGADAGALQVLSGGGLQRRLPPQRFPSHRGFLRQAPAHEPAHDGHAALQGDPDQGVPGVPLQPRRPVLRGRELEHRPGLPDLLLRDGMQPPGPSVQGSLRLLDGRRLAHRLHGGGRGSVRV
mmetsp:Transcript_71733/g.226687  ORF Transcript_71733/g.226687 Transcript_71733/m.226687 type:complete len:370 (-) Transcript_71733:2213-3322(-)